MNDFEIRAIRIADLFGVIPLHNIELREGGITFIHGPNGCGKTTCLRLIDAVFNWEISVLFEIQFSWLEIEKSGGEVLKVTKTLRERDSRHVAELSFNQGRNKEYTIKPGKDLVRISPAEIEEYVPSLVRVGAREWMDRNDGRKFEFNDVIKKYIYQFQPSLNKERPEWLDKFIKSVNLHFIKTQRLLKVDYSSVRRHRPEESTIAEVINLYSNEIKDSINKKLAEQAAMSQGHDRSFPQRLLSLSIDNTVSEDEIRAEYASTEKKIQKLVEAGLIDKQDNIALPQKKFEDTERRVLWLYLNDVNKKLEVFDDIQNKIQTFLDLVGKKFKTKKFTVNREDGFSIHVNNKPNDALPPTQLSSGEQHQIVLFYELIFKASENSFFLIDEPEISLHVDWQRMFLSDIDKIAKLGNRQFLIATHSPQIIGNHRKLAVALNEGILDE